MCEIFVLFEGYSTQIDDVTMDANCSCTLIKGPNNKNVIVDTMTAWDKQAIVEGNIIALTFFCASPPKDTFLS